MSLISFSKESARQEQLARYDVPNNEIKRYAAGTSHCKKLQLQVCLDADYRWDLTCRCIYHCRNKSPSISQTVF